MHLPPYSFYCSRGRGDTCLSLAESELRAPGMLLAASGRRAAGLAVLRTTLPHRHGDRTLTHHGEAAAVTRCHPKRGAPSQDRRSPVWKRPQQDPVQPFLAKPGLGKLDQPFNSGTRRQVSPAPPSTRSPRTAREKPTLPPRTTGNSPPCAPWATPGGSGREAPACSCFVGALF